MARGIAEASRQVAAPESSARNRLGSRSRTAHGPGGKAHEWGHCGTPYFSAIVMLPSMSLRERLGPKLSNRLLVSTRRPLRSPSVISPTRWV